MQELLKFVLLLIFEIPATFVSILILIYFITHRAARSKAKNHVWLVLLVVSSLQSTIHLPMSMSFYYLGEIRPAIDSYCVWWTWFEYSTTATSLILIAWASTERHLLIFHATFLLGGSWRKWMFHIIPITCCTLFASLWYIALVVISPECTNTWDFGYIVCGLPCYISTGDGTYGIVDTLITIVIPLGILLLANMTLIIRVIYERISRQQNVNWRRHRKMAFQLWFISSLYVAGWLPLAITLMIRIIANPSFLDNQLADMIYTLNFIPLLLPFVCLGAFPEIINSIREYLRKQHRNQVGTGSIALQTVSNNQ
jgi:hypothetical protein